MESRTAAARPRLASSIMEGSVNFAQCNDSSGRELIKERRGCLVHIS